MGSGTLLVPRNQADPAEIESRLHEIRVELNGLLKMCARLEQILFLNVDEA
jgi:hypothetical protein